MIPGNEEEWGDQPTTTTDVVQPTELNENERKALSDKSSSRIPSTHPGPGERLLWLVLQAVEGARTAGLFEFLWHFLVAVLGTITVIAWVHLFFTCRDLFKLMPPY